MRKKKLVLIAALLLSVLPGCSKQKEPQADHMMLCSFLQEDEAGKQDHSALFTYVEENGETITADIKTSYEGFEKDEVNNKVLTDMTIRKSILDNIEGVNMELYRTDTGFGSREQWEYSSIDTASIAYSDEIQAPLINENEGIYSIENIREYYESIRYQCSISEVNQ